MIYLIGIEAALKDNWRELVPGPKLGRLKDPEKIASKQAEWEEGAAVIALNDRMASRITKFKIWGVEKGAESTKPLTEGEGGSELAEAYKAGIPRDNRTLVFAFDARNRLSQAALEAVNAGVKGIAPELFFTDSARIAAESMSLEVPKLIDPVKVFSKSSEDLDMFLKYITIDKGLTIGSASLEEQHAALLNTVSILKPW